MFYDNANMNALMEFMRNLKKYGNKNFFIYNNDEYIMQIHTLLSLMKLNGLKVVFDIKDADIVINGGREKTLEEFADEDFRLSNEAYFADKNVEDGFINKKIEEYKTVKDILDENFSFDKLLYLQNIEEEKYSVRLYKKKEKSEIGN